MLTEEQVDAAIKCIQVGGGPEFKFADAKLCDVLDEIINHLQTQRIEDSLFKTVSVQEVPEPREFTQMTPEEAHYAFVHHTMHWAFQLGVGAALMAVGQDLDSSPFDEED